MDFWAHQEDAKRRTIRLVALYIALVFLLSLLAGVAVACIWAAFVDDPGLGGVSFLAFLFLRPELYIGSLGCPGSRRE